MRPQLQPRPHAQERRLLHEDPHHMPGRDQIQSQEDHQEERRQDVYPHPEGPGRKAQKVLQRRPDETRRVRLEDELRRRMPRVRGRHRGPRTQADHPQLRPGDSPQAPGGRQDGRQGRDSHRRLHQGPRPGQPEDEQRARAHLRRRADARPRGQRGVAHRQGRRPRLRWRAGAD